MVLKIYKQIYCTVYSCYNIIKMSVIKAYKYNYKSLCVWSSDAISYCMLAPQNGHSWIPRNIFFRHFGHRGFNIDERMTTPTAPNPRPTRKSEYLRLSRPSALDLLFLSIIIFTRPANARFYTKWHTPLSKFLVISFVPLLTDQTYPETEFYSLLILYLMVLRIILTALLVPFDFTNIALGNSLS